MQDILCGGIEGVIWAHSILLVLEFPYIRASVHLQCADAHYKFRKDRERMKPPIWIFCFYFFHLQRGRFSLAMITEILALITDELGTRRVQERTKEIVKWILAATIIQTTSQFISLIKSQLRARHRLLLRIFHVYVKSTLFQEFERKIENIIENLY